MSHIYYSAARGGFFHAANHPDLPEDAVRVSRLRHRQLLDAQAQGRQIVPNDKGRPVLAPVVPPSLEQLRARASAAVNAEAGRRIKAVATIKRQTNDNAVIAQAALAVATGAAQPAGLAEALARRAAIDTIRAASNRAAALIAQMPAANLANFDATAERLWLEG